MNNVIISHRKTAKIVGTLFIIAAVTAIAAVLLYRPILNNSNYLVDGAAHKNQIVLGAILELILACSVIGISISMFPIFRKYNESLALGYVCFRLFEAALIVVGVVSVLSLLTLSQDFIKGGSLNVASFQPAGTMLIAIHDWTFKLGPDFMLGVNTLICGYLLYKTKLVPRFIAGAGLLGATFILFATVMEMFGLFLPLSTWGKILALPVAAYEMTLAVWLIVRGFDLSFGDSSS